jgi:cytochrome bd-type quinol oxidase subunit 2
MLAEPPSNGQYMIAAYVVTVAILLGYWLLLWRAMRNNVSGERQRKR